MEYYASLVCKRQGIDIFAQIHTEINYVAHKPKIIHNLPLCVNEKIVSVKKYILQQTQLSESFQNNIKH